MNNNDMITRINDLENDIFKVYTNVEKLLRERIDNLESNNSKITEYITELENQKNKIDELFKEQ